MTLEAFLDCQLEEGLFYRATRERAEDALRNAGSDDQC
jgi:hypothetical protein